MTEQAENAVQRYRRSLEQALKNAPHEIKAEAIQDADEFLHDEIHAMDVGSLTSEDAAFERFVQRFGTPEQLASQYMDQRTEPVLSKRSGQWKKVAALAVMLFMFTGSVCYAMLREPPKLSPFTKVVFEGEQVFVTYDGEISRWIELDQLTVKEIVASAKKQFGDHWQKRIAEDLVEVLWGMEHRPGNTVRLCLLNTKTKVEQVVEKANLTHENRQAVWEDQVSKMECKPLKRSPFIQVAFKKEQISKVGGKPPPTFAFYKGNV